jgi:hypothetical protein
MKPFVALHVETTGLGEGASPVLFDAVVFDRGGVELATFTQLLKPYEHSEWEQGAIDTHWVTKEFADYYGASYNTVGSSITEWLKNFTPVVSFQVETEISLGRMGVTLDKSELFDVAQMVHVQRLRSGCEDERKYTCGVGLAVESLRLQTEQVRYVGITQDVSIPTRNMARKIRDIFVRLINKQ